MKKLILVGLTVILFTACQNTGKTNYTRTSPEIDEVKALLKDYQDGNWEAWAAHYADTAKIYHNNWKIGVTPAEASKDLKSVLANVSGYQFEQDGNDDPWYEMVVNDKGDAWVYFWGNWKGTLAANGEEIEIAVHLAFRFADSKVVKEEGYYNLSEFTAAMAEIAAASMAEKAEATE